MLYQLNYMKKLHIISGEIWIKSILNIAFTAYYVYKETSDNYLIMFSTKFIRLVSTNNKRLLYVIIFNYCFSQETNSDLLRVKGVRIVCY